MKAKKDHHLSMFRELDEKVEPLKRDKGSKQRQRQKAQDWICLHPRSFDHSIISFPFLRFVAMLLAHVWGKEGRVDSNTETRNL